MSREIYCCYGICSVAVPEPGEREGWKTFVTLLLLSRSSIRAVKNDDPVKTVHAYVEAPRTMKMPCL